jgi:hypothetical protein
MKNNVFLSFFVLDNDIYHQLLATANKDIYDSINEIMLDKVG